MKKLLPIGIQTFSKIRERNYVYIDKTEIAHRLIESGTDYYFLSRPRRFGKSLFLDTLSDIFKGRKELFEGLYIYDKRDWSEKHPIIKISFGSGNFSSEQSTKRKIEAILKYNCEDNEVEYEECYNEDPGLYFECIIRTLYEKYNRKVVILIDEYDKPILDNITDKEAALTGRRILKDFYSAIKDNDSYIRFLFITGVSKFSKLNLFSGLNNLEDITINKEFATITGYTQADLETHFEQYLEGLDKEAIKRWYNGYNYFGEPIYNPFDVLLFFSNSGEFRNYWWGTGNPSFLIEKLKEQRFFLPDINNLTVTAEVLDAFDVEYIDLVALLWQTGYLTFAGKETLMGMVSYKLKIPNLEIQTSLYALFLDYLTKLQQQYTAGKLETIRTLLRRDFAAFEKELFTLFASIPADNYRNNPVAKYEGYYASVIYSFLSSIGFQTIPEDTSNKGKIDLTMIGNGMTLIVEFKVDCSNEKAIKQIESRKYYEKYLTNGTEIYMIGIHFSSEDRNVTGLEWKKIENN